MKIIIMPGSPPAQTYAGNAGSDGLFLKVKGSPCDFRFGSVDEAHEIALAILTGLRKEILFPARVKHLPPEEEGEVVNAEEEGEVVNVRAPGGHVLFRGRRGASSPSYEHWHRVIPEGFIDLPPSFTVEKADD